MQYANIILETADRVATIRLNRPDALNALNLELLAEFSHAVKAVAEDEVRQGPGYPGRGAGLLRRRRPALSSIPYLTTSLFCHPT